MGKKCNFLTIMKPGLNGLLVGMMGVQSVAALTHDADDIQRLADLSLEQLGSIEITSVSRRAEKLSDAAASIYVITREDIRRSGLNTIPEVLRLAPNLQVARVNANQYAISARGFNNAIGNKLLVLIDGRTIYTPLFSGVNWDSQFVLLQDVERIEVISGPGASLWGANAVNGVINIITRPAQETQGALLSAGGGTREKTVDARYGGKLGADASYRIYATGAEQDHTVLANGSKVSDGWKNAQFGFRTDWGDAASGWTVQGDTYQTQADTGPLGRWKTSGSNLLTRWTQQWSDGSNFHLQAYYDHTERDDPLTVRNEIDLYDFELQHGFSFWETHRFVWGGGYRYASDSFKTNFNALNPLPQALSPPERHLRWGNLFFQDEIALSPRLNFTIGLKVETNIYTGAEYLPNVRLAFKPSADQLWWGALSRAVRAPARIDRDFHLFLSLPGTPLIPVISGGPDFQSEVADVVELGYRAQPTNNFSYSVTVFHHDYDKLRSGQPPPRALVQNMMEGETYGIEAWANFQPARFWKLSAGLVRMHEDLRIKPGSRDPTGPSALGNDPELQWTLRSSINLTDRHEFDLNIRRVGALPNPVVPAYTAVDARLGRSITPEFDASLTVRNLFDPRHVEFGSRATASAIQRGVFLKLQWRM